ncbi:TetR/AcrR family transcriptional regulator [Rhizobium sp. ICMP 5592]|uniref:TetR/AcrR family transcriptional regulator n=1 Tax=Rhizobium sp. ICMP 5592 TaxID=2292445 RepID=UPI001886A484|nr:TetR/AcrR family transcriptional regulator [Rhizobium sp. ICMP 5592]
MPKFVDSKARKEDIVRIAMEVLAQDGYEKFSLRNVGKRLGGSQSLVTHYFASRESLFSELAGMLADGWTVEIRECLEGKEAPRDRVKALMIWLIPDTSSKLDAEKARMQISAAKFRDPIAAKILSDFDAFVRQNLSDIIRELVPEDEVEPVVDLVRSVSTGIELETYEHGWSPERQHRTVSLALDRFLPGNHKETSATDEGLHNCVPLTNASY